MSGISLLTDTSVQTLELDLDPNSAPYQFFDLRDPV